MYCPDCRQERLSNAQHCALCGTAMTARPRAAVEAELSHVHFLLDELKRWDAAEVPANARRFLSERYERQARILLSVLSELTPEAARPLAPVTVHGSAAASAPVKGESAVALAPVTVAPPETGNVAVSRKVADFFTRTVEVSPAVPAAAEVKQTEVPVTAVAEVPAEAAAPVPAEVAGTEAPAGSGAAPVVSGSEAQASAPVTLGAEGTGGTRASASGGEARGSVGGASGAARQGARASEGASAQGRNVPRRPPSLPPTPAEPYFEPPAPKSLTARLVEETSTWNRVWRPFLYESIMWFIGAFLILSGTLYFVFESWAGMSSSVRSLTVFGLTAGYSVGFSIWGAFLARREALRGSGRILGLIGSAAAPLAGIALGPMGLGESLQLDGVGAMLLVPLLALWAGAAAWLVRKPADSLDAPSRPLVQAALVASTLMMGLAPLAARLGVHALWLDVLPCVLFFVLSSRPTPQPRQGAALVFALAAPLYLMALYAVRLHVALGDAGMPPEASTYAPFAAFLLATALRFRKLGPDTATDALTLVVACLQGVCLVAAIGAPAPNFFLTAAIIAWTQVTLARGGRARLPWVYGAYTSLYFAYASSPQMVPGAVRRLIDALKVQLGYPVTGALPLQYGALTALPFILAGAVFALSRLWRDGRTGNARDAALAEVLLRATAIASPLFALYGMAGPDVRPAFWSALGLSLLCLAVGLLAERFYLTTVGAGLVLLVPFQAAALLGAPAASAVSGAVALGLAVVCTLCTRRTRWLLAGTVGVVATAGFFMGLLEGETSAGVGVALCGAAALLAAWALQSARLLACAAVLAAAAVPKLVAQLGPDAVPPALALMALGLALLGERGGLLRLFGITAVFYALLASLGGVLTEQVGLGLIVLTAAGAVAVASRTFPAVRPLAVSLVALVLVRDHPNDYAPWSGWMTAPLSTALFVLWALGASILAARRGRTASTTTAGVAALLLPLTNVVGAHSAFFTPLMVSAALVALLTARALPAAVSVGVAALYAGIGLSSLGPVALLGLAAVLSVLAVLEEVPAVLRVGAGGSRFALVATLAAGIVLLPAAARWDDAGLPLLLVGTVTLPLLWTRANRVPFLATLMVPYSVLGLVAGGTPPGWTAALPLVALAVVRAVEHLPAVASLLLRSRDEAPRHALSLAMQGWLGAVGLGLLLTTAWMGNLPLYFLVASLVLLPGPRPFIRVCGAAMLLLLVPEARPVATGLLLALALAEHHRPQALWAFFRSPQDELLLPACTFTALALAGLPVVAALPEPSAPAWLGLAGVLALSAFLLSNRWLLAPAVLGLALAPVGVRSTDFLAWRSDVGLYFTAVVLGAALLSALCQSGRVQRALTAATHRLTPGVDGTWSEPLWAGSVTALALMLAGHLTLEGAGSVPVPEAVGAVLTALVLMRVRARWMANVATVLLGASLAAAVPPLWAPAVVSGAGMLLCLVGMALDKKGVAVGAALHHGGWVMALLPVVGLRDLEHLGTPLCILFGLGAAWTVVLRRPGREVVGWLASLAAAHGWMMHLGAVYSSGRGSVFILPYFGAASAVVAMLALFVAGKPWRRGLGHGFTLVAMTEVLLGLFLLGTSGDALREALVASAALGVLLFALVRRAAVEEDEASAFLAQAVLALGYLCVRVLGMGERPGAADSLAALVGGALFTGLYFLVQREGSGLAAFRRPALLGAYLFPLAGLLSAPWHEPLGVAALLVGHAAHFAALGTHPQRRGLASLASVVAFNAALLVVWRGTGGDEPQYYVIPAGLSLLALLRVFRASIDEDTYAKLRALAVTAIYVAGAWKPLMFSDGGSMLLCVVLCVVGVGFGIALRVRSYVYLGTAFLVTCIAANLVRFGMRDHRVAAASLFMLGLLVIGAMVLLSAHRAALLQRYGRVRALLATWEG
jgi:hypothetical protein